MGHPRSSMIATIVAVFINIILDPIFIFGWGMGVRGAALATIISQVIAVLWQMTIFFDKREIVHFHKGIWKLEKDITLSSFSIGMSPFLMNLAHCFVVIIINNQLKLYGGDMALAAYGVTNRLVFVFAMIVMGLNQGMQPIVGYNFGAHQYRRMIRAFELTSICATFVMGSVVLLGELVPEWMVRMFTHDAALIDISIHPMRIIVCALLVVGFQMVTGNFFTSIGMAGKAIFMSLTRQVIYLIPLALLLPMAFTQNPIDGVWWSLPISDVLSAITAAIILITQMRKFRQQIDEDSILIGDEQILGNTCE